MHGVSIQEEMIRGRTKWYREIEMDRLWSEWRPAAGAAVSPRAAIASKIFYAGVRLLFDLVVFVLLVQAAEMFLGFCLLNKWCENEFGGRCPDGRARAARYLWSESAGKTR